MRDTDTDPDVIVCIRHSSMKYPSGTSVCEERPEKALEAINVCEGDFTVSKASDMIFLVCRILKWKRPSQ